MDQGETTMPCKWCHAPTWHTGTGCCDGCWELSSRIQGNPALAARILNETTARVPSKEAQDVRNFHQKFGLLCFDKPGHLSSGKLKERIEFLQEELDEFIEAAGFNPTYDSSGGRDGLNNHGVQNLAQQADALVDLVYVALGTAAMLGLPWDWLWDDVQRANMQKVRGMTKRGHAVDVTKPPGWQGPQGDRILHLAGYNPAEEYRDDTQRD